MQVRHFYYGKLFRAETDVSDFRVTAWSQGLTVNNAESIFYQANIGTPNSLLLRQWQGIAKDTFALLNLKSQAYEGHVLIHGKLSRRQPRGHHYLEFHYYILDKVSVIPWALNGFSVFQSLSNTIFPEFREYTSLDFAQLITPQSLDVIETERVIGYWMSMLREREIRLLLEAIHNRQPVAIKMHKDAKRVDTFNLIAFISMLHPTRRSELTFASDVFDSEKCTAWVKILAPSVQPATRDGFIDLTVSQLPKQEHNYAMPLTREHEDMLLLWKDANNTGRGFSEKRARLIANLQQYMRFGDSLQAKKSLPDNTQTVRTNTSETQRISSHRDLIRDTAVDHRFDDGKGRQFSNDDRFKADVLYFLNRSDYDEVQRILAGRYVENSQIPNFLFDVDEKTVELFQRYILIEGVITPELRVPLIIALFKAGYVRHAIRQVILDVNRANLTRRHLAQIQKFINTADWEQLVRGGSSYEVQVVREMFLSLSTAQKVSPTPVSTPISLGLVAEEPVPILSIATSIGLNPIGKIGEIRDILSVPEEGTQVPVVSITDTLLYKDEYENDKYSRYYYIERRARYSATNTVIDAAIEKEYEILKRLYEANGKCFLKPYGELQKTPESADGLTDAFYYLRCPKPFSTIDSRKCYSYEEALTTRTTSEYEVDKKMKTRLSYIAVVREIVSELEKLGICHGDISVRNIIFLPDHNDATGQRYRPYLIGFEFAIENARYQDLPNDYKAALKLKQTPIKKWIENRRNTHYNFPDYVAAALLAVQFLCDSRQEYDTVVMTINSPSDQYAPESLVRRFFPDQADTQSDRYIIDESAKLQRMFVRAFNYGQWHDDIIEKDKILYLYIKNYTIVQYIDQGRYAKVYRGQSRDRKNYAIKFRNAKTLSISEQKIVEHLGDSRYLVKIYDNFVHTTEDAAFLIYVEEYLAGGNLRTYAEQSPLHIRTEEETRLAQRMEWMRQVLDGLKDLHKINVVHGDIKPENVMLTNNPQQDERSEIRIIDFQGENLGTEGYRLNTNGNDAANDLYAVAVMMYELVTGRHPYADKNKKNATDPLHYNRHLNTYFARFLFALVSNQTTLPFTSASELQEALACFTGYYTGLNRPPRLPILKFSTAATLHDGSHYRNASASHPPTSSLTG